MGEEFNATHTPEKVIVFDVDDTILKTQGRDFYNSKPIPEMVEAMVKLKNKGWKIVLHTSRGMGRSQGSIELVRDDVLKEIKTCLSRHNIPYDELLLGKTWATAYVDDKAMTPEYFLKKIDSLILDS